MTGRGRPPVGPPLTIRLPAELREALRVEAEQEKVSAAEIIRRALVERYN